MKLFASDSNIKPCRKVRSNCSHYSGCITIVMIVSTWFIWTDAFPLIKDRIYKAYVLNNHNIFRYNKVRIVLITFFLWLLKRKWKNITTAPSSQVNIHTVLFNIFFFPSSHITVLPLLNWVKKKEDQGLMSTMTLFY